MTKQREWWVVAGKLNISKCLINALLQVIDHENWIMNLREANLYDYPIWYKLYSTRVAYGMKGLRPSDWDELINTMTNNPEVFDLYYK